MDDEALNFTMFTIIHYTKHRLLYPILLIQSASHQQFVLTISQLNSQFSSLIWN